MIKKAKKADGAALAVLALQMWPDHSLRELQEEFEELTENGDAACFLKYEGEIPGGIRRGEPHHLFSEEALTAAAFPA